MVAYLPRLNNLFSQFDEIKLVYLFGSQVTKKTTQLSDYDFAIYLDEKTPVFRRSDIILNLNTEISSIINTDKIDLVILNDRLSSSLKFNVVNGGKLIYEKTPYKILIEPQIYSEYFDFKVFSKINNL